MRAQPFDHGWLDAADQARLSELAQAQARTVPELLREAVRTYLSPQGLACHERFQRTLLSLSKQKAFTGGDLNEALRVVCETAAQALEVERVGVWLYRDAYTRLECICLYTRSTNTHATGPTLSASEVPAYFKALEQNRVVAVEDAPGDPRTCQLGDYLSQHGVSALLDAPIHVDGKTSGVVCHEHVDGARPWSLDAQSFAASIGDMASLIIGQAERKRAELEVIRRTVQLEQAQALSRTMSEFVNSVAHELRTPLTSVMGLLEFLEEGIGGALSAQQADLVRQLRANAQRLERLVTDLLDLARIQAGTFALDRREIDLHDLVADLVASLQPQARQARLELTAALSPQPVRLVADPERVAQVLGNLIINALKFTPAGGRVTVTLAPAADGARLEVRDTGEGIAPEDIPHLFDRFMQLSSGKGKGGLGLGLAISKALVEAHGGQIGVESAPGEGATFWFTLSAAPAALSAADAPPSPGSNSGARSDGRGPA